MLDNDIRQQLGAYLERVQQPFEMVATLDDSAKSVELRELLEDIAALRPDKITLRTDGSAERAPAFTLARPGSGTQLTFAAIPMGHEFTSLILALLWSGGHPPKFAPEVLEQIEQLDVDLDFEVYMSLSCHNCPDVVQALSLMAILNPRVRTTVIDGALFQDEVEAREIMGVPVVFQGEAMFHSGRITLEEILQKVDTGAAARDAARLSAKDPFDVLVVGGGPAGAAAAIYAARKGIRTGVVAERFGGQVNDTGEIANYPGISQTTGPEYAAHLEAHVRDYEVDIMTAQRAARLLPASAPGGLITLELENGGRLQSRSIILATGARWRNVGVPGEQEYKTKGVAYCPHCDGPLFKGKDVAVIGGGNSGVEAAIDLAGVVRHVTVLEFMPEMKADQVLILASSSRSERLVTPGGVRVVSVVLSARRRSPSHSRPATVRLCSERRISARRLEPQVVWSSSEVDSTRRRMGPALTPTSLRKSRAMVWRYRLKLSWLSQGVSSLPS